MRRLRRQRRHGANYSDKMSRIPGIGEGDEPMPLKEAASTLVAAGLAVDLVAVLAAITNSQPRVMTIRDGAALPSGPFELDDRSLQSGLRGWVERQTGHPLGYVEQLYTFADRDRAAEGTARRFISISYLGLTREERAKSAGDAGWHNWYDYFPWEDSCEKRVTSAEAPRNSAEVANALPRRLSGNRIQRASRCQGLTLSSTISARNLPCSAVMRPTVMGRRKRRGPALPGLKKSVPFFVSILGWCE